MTKIKLTVSLILAGLVVLFAIQNAVVVEVRFMFWSLFISRALLLFLVFAFGMVAGWLLHRPQVKEEAPPLPPPQL